MGNTVKVGLVPNDGRKIILSFYRHFCTRTPHGKCASTVVFFKLKNDKKSHSRNQTDFRERVHVSLGTRLQAGSGKEV